jgi:hypothetical protein
MRRGFLVAGVLGMCAVAPSRVRGATATEVEGVGYVGEAPGGFTCGPSVRAKYAGGAARVRVSENDKRILGSGFSVEGAGSLARERYGAFECYDSCPSVGENGEETRLPDAWMGGGHLRGGYSNDNFGIAFGVSAFNMYRSETSTSPGLYAFPDLEMGGGVTGSYRILGGIGTPTINSLRNPGLYIGTDVAIGAGELQARFGLHRVGATDSGGARLELTGYLPLVPRLDLRLSGTAVEWEGHGGGEGSVGLRAGF